MKIAVRSTPSTSQKRRAEPSQSLIRLVAPTGMTKNSPTASRSEKKIVRPQMKPPISSSSSPSDSCLLAEIASARKPIASDSPRATTPRMTGSRQIRWRTITERTLWLTSAISPSGFRTATAQWEGPRIIAPSRTACPPIALIEALFALGAGTLEPPLEALDPAARVEQLLLARVERVAVRAHLDVELGLGGARLERVPAGAGHVREHVLGMDTGFHRPAKIAEATSAATLPPETMHATRVPGGISIFPERRAATAAAPAGSQASLARE